MSKLFRLNLLSISLIGLLLFGVNNVLACSCITLPFEEMFDSSTSVFEGTVIRIEKPENEYSVDPVKVTFQVTRVWKGESLDKIIIYTENQTTACGYPFGDQPGSAYLVYAYEYEGRLSTNLCTRTRLRSQAVGDLLRLNIRNNGLGISMTVASTVILVAVALFFRKRIRG